MDVVFTSKKLSDDCSRQTLANRRWGAAGAKKIALRLQQLAAATTLDDMNHLPGRCHELKGDLAGHLAVDLHHPYRMTFRPTADPPPSKADGGLDWTAVDSVTIVDIVDYHQ